MKKLKVDRTWTLFLDRDGVMNQRLPGRYVNSVDEFWFLPGVLEVVPLLSEIFARLIIVTNQQGLSKGLMTEEELDTVHRYMLSEIARNGGRIDAVYYCGDSAEQVGNCRKPAPDMGYRAKEDFPNIDFSKSVMIGDSASDIKFGKRLGMKTFLTGEKLGCEDLIAEDRPDIIINSLHDVPQWLIVETRPDSPD